MKATSIAVHAQTPAAEQNSAQSREPTPQNTGIIEPQTDPRPSLETRMKGPAASERIFDRFIAVADACPSARALVHNHEAWTYGQLERASRALALELLAKAAPNELVAIVAPRSPELVLGMLACLRAGLTFVVIDAAYPRERIKQLAETAAPGRVLTFKGASGTGFGQIAIPAREGRAGTRSPVCFHFEKEALETLLHSNSLPAPSIDTVGADSIAYLLFTSGTTGCPKCIKTSHHPLVHFIGWYSRVFPVDSASRFSMLSGVGHDPVLRDIFVPLSFGAELHIPPEGALKNPPSLFSWLMEAGVSHTHITPQMGRVICSARNENETLPALRFIFSGGDMLRRKLVAELAEAAPAAMVVNFYGTSETPQAMAFHPFNQTSDAADDTVPIGTGIDDAQLLVLDDALRLAAIGARGQIAIRTKFLSLGYVGDSEATAAKFVPNPDKRDPEDRIYLTGDFGTFAKMGLWFSTGAAMIRLKSGDTASNSPRLSGILSASLKRRQRSSSPRRRPMGKTD